METLFKSFAHVAVKSKDIDESIAFYEKIGGKLLIKEDHGNRKLALIKIVDTTIEIIENDQVFYNDGVVAHFTFYVDDVESVGQKFIELGIKPKTEKPLVLNDVFNGITNWFFFGPNGEQIELLKMKDSKLRN